MQDKIVQRDEEEQTALRQQLMILKELHKKNQEECKEKLKESETELAKAQKELEEKSTLLFEKQTEWQYEKQQYEEQILSLKQNLEALQSISAPTQVSSESLETVKEEMQRLQQVVEDYEFQLRTAQQHLAKKVKEATWLNEKVEQQQQRIQELEKSNEALLREITQLQNALDISTKQERKAQEQLHIAILSIENQVSKWEEKYFYMYDKWQDSEKRMSELRKIEEKFHQIQLLVSHLDAIVKISSPNE